MSSGYILKKMVKNMKIKDADTENMTNDEINSLIKKLYQSKSQASGGISKVNIRTLSNADIAFDKNGKYYELLKTSLKDQLCGSLYYPFFQKNTTNLVEIIEWTNYSSSSSYDEVINWAFRYKDNKSKSADIGYDSINIFIMNYDE